MSSKLQRMPKKPKVLLVEDEEDLAELMQLHLKSEGLDVTWLENGEDALEQAGRENFQLAILDWMLPGISGLEICKALKGKLPILMVTARSSSADLVLGLEMGADDYVVKPFEIPVFTARVRALLRRGGAFGASAELAQKKIFEMGDLAVDVAKVEARCGKAEIKLTASEFKLLVALLENQGKVLSREMLVKAIQGQGVTVVGRTIDTHVLAIRKKLGQCSDLIETIRGVGYRVKA